MSLRYLNCLIFVAHSEENPDPWKSPAPPHDRLIIKETATGFALLPPIQDQYPQEFEILRHCFTHIGIPLINRVAECPSVLTTAISDSRVEIVEVVLDLNDIETHDRIIVQLDIFNESLVKALLVPPFNIEATHFLYLPLPYSKYDSRSVLEEANLPIFEHLLSFGANLRYRGAAGETLLHFAVKKRCEPLVWLLLRYGAQPEARTLEGLTALHVAAETDRTPASIINLLTQYGADINSTVDGDTPLCFALYRMHQSADVVKALLDNGAWRGIEYLGGSFQHLIVNSNSVCLACYLSYHPDISVQDRREALKAVLKAPVVRKRTVSVLLYYGFDLSVEDANDVDVFFNAISADNLQLVQKLLEWGASIHSRTDGGLTVLHIATRKSVSKGMIRLLIYYGADINAKTERGKTPLSFALSGKLETLEFLLVNGASIEDDPTILHEVVDCPWGDEYLQKITFLLEKGADVNGRNDKGETPISLASFYARKDVLDILSRYGAKMDPEDERVRDNMLCQIEEGKLDRLMHLVRIGANIEGIMEEALVTSVEERQKEITGFLLDFDDPRARTSDKSTLLERVVSSTRPAAIEDILEYNYLNVHDIIDSGVFDAMPALCFDHSNSPSSYISGFRADSNDVFDAKDALCSHISAVLAANLKVNQKGAEYEELPHWLLESESFYSKEDCEMQLNAMKNTIITGSSLSFFDVLNASAPKLNCYLRNETLEQVLNSDRYGDFPIYNGIISKRFRRAYYRRSLIMEGIKMLDFWSYSFRKLSLELKEMIFDCLSNQNLLVLTNVCKLPAGRSK